MNKIEERFIEHGSALICTDYVKYSAMRIVVSAGGGLGRGRARMNAEKEEELGRGITLIYTDLFH